MAETNKRPLEEGDDGFAEFKKSKGEEADDSQTPEKKREKLVDFVKKFTRVDQEKNSVWKTFCDNRKVGGYDPNRRELFQLEQFMQHLEDNQISTKLPKNIPVNLPIAAGPPGQVVWKGWSMDTGYGGQAGPPGGASESTGIASVMAAGAQAAASFSGLAENPMMKMIAQAASNPMMMGGLGVPTAGMGGLGLPTPGLGGLGLPAPALGGLGVPMAGLGGFGNPMAGLQGGASLQDSKSVPIAFWVGQCIGHWHYSRDGINWTSYEIQRSADEKLHYVQLPPPGKAAATAICGELVPEGEWLVATLKKEGASTALGKIRLRLEETAMKSQIQAAGKEEWGTVTAASRKDGSVAPAPQKPATMLEKLHAEATHIREGTPIEEKPPEKPPILNAKTHQTAVQAMREHLKATNPAIKPPPPEPEKEENQVCAYFLKGRCTFGDKCLRRHEGDPEVTKSAPSNAKVCPFFQRGFCGFGDQCVDIHVPPKEVCGYFLKGRCVWGDKCEKSHDPQTADMSKIKVCPFYLNGWCGFGDECADAHVGQPRDVSTEACPHWMNGNCSFGESCYRIHDTSQSSSGWGSGIDGGFDGGFRMDMMQNMMNVGMVNVPMQEFGMEGGCAQFPVVQFGYPPF